MTPNQNFRDSTKDTTHCCQFFFAYRQKAQRFSDTFNEVEGKCVGLLSGGFVFRSHAKLTTAERYIIYGYRIGPSDMKSFFFYRDGSNAFRFSN